MKYVGIPLILCVLSGCGERKTLFTERPLAENTASETPQERQWGRPSPVCTVVKETRTVDCLPEAFSPSGEKELRTGMGEDLTSFEFPFPEREY